MKGTMRPYKSSSRARYHRLPSESSFSTPIEVTDTISANLKIVGSLISATLFTALVTYAFLWSRMEGGIHSPAALFSQLQVQLQETLFTPSDSYHKGVSWKAEIPSGGGYVTTQGREEPDTEETYVVSMYHQLHCLEFINTALFPSGLPGCRDVANSEESHHLQHCIEYLSSAISCAADITLEKATVTPLEGGKYNYFVGEESAWGTIHRCRDLSQISALTNATSVSRYSRQTKGRI